MYFLKVCVIFLRVHIGYDKSLEVKHTIYVGQPNEMKRHDRTMHLLSWAHTIQYSTHDAVSWPPSWRRLRSWKYPAFYVLKAPKHCYLGRECDLEILLVLSNLLHFSRLPIGKRWTWNKVPKMNKIVRIFCSVSGAS